MMMMMVLVECNSQGCHESLPPVKRADGVDKHVTGQKATEGGTRGSSNAVRSNDVARLMIASLVSWSLVDNNACENCPTKGTIALVRCSTRSLEAANRV